MSYRALVDAARKASALGLNPGRAGNLSIRSDDGFVITPSGVPYSALTESNLVAMDADGRPRGELAPSSEWRMHRDIYARHPDAQAIVHTHSPFATTLACLDRGIPAFHYMIAVAGGTDIRCAPYATFGTQQLSDHALRALAGRRACLLAHHGMIAVGESLKAALALAVEVETLAEMYWRALQIGEPANLAPDEMDTVLRKFEDYGKP